MNGETIYHVQIGDSHSYFGSISAIYDIYTPEEIGIKKTSLWSYGIKEDHPYTGRKCIIRKGKIVRKKGGRNGRKESGL